MTLYDKFKSIYTAEEPCTVLKTLECLLKATKSVKVSGEGEGTRRFSIDGFIDGLGGTVQAVLNFPAMIEEPDSNTAQELLINYLHAAQAVDSYRMWPCSGVVYNANPGSVTTYPLVGAYARLGDLYEEGFYLVGAKPSDTTSTILGGVNVRTLRVRTTLINL